VEFSIADGFYQTESRMVSGQIAVNCYPVKAEAPSLNPTFVVGTPGITQLATTGTLLQANRGSHVMNGVAYVINGGKLWEFTSANALVDRGNIERLDRVSLADNGYQLMILVPGGKGYIYNKDTTTLSEIVDADFRANGDPQHVVFIDGYFICSTDSKQFITSDLNDGMAWDALDFGSAESDPDDIVAPAKVGNRLFILGSETVEEFQNIGGAAFPFQRTGLVLPKGCSAPFSVIESQGALYWIGGGENESPAIWSLSGNSLNKASSNAVDLLLHNLTAAEVSAIYAQTYADKGQYFVCFYLPDQAICFDSQSGVFHQRQSYIDSAQTAWRVASIFTAYNRTLCADTVDGRIGELLDTVYQEYGEPIIRQIILQPFYNQGAAFFVPWLELVGETGVGSDLSEDPLIELELSRDGKIWTQPRARRLGKQGEYRHRIVWLKLGRCSNYVQIRLTMSEPVKFVAVKFVGEVFVAQK